MHRRRRAVLRYHAPVRLCVRQNQDVVPAVRWAVREIGEACDPLVALPRACTSVLCFWLPACMAVKSGSVPGPGCEPSTAVADGGVGGHGGVGAPQRACVRACVGSSLTIRTPNLRLRALADDPLHALLRRGCASGGCLRALDVRCPLPRASGEAILQALGPSGALES
eukprot:COSAG01_NODE_457_length_16751_cov_34.906918_22_plen_168_part_00